MNTILLALTSFFILQSIQAATLPIEKSEFCSRFNEDPKNQMSIQDFANNPENLMSFKNNGGLFNGGVCWWHSRFQRNIFYLSIFRPDLPKLDRAGIKALIAKIRLGNSVVTIPGHHNFEEFSNEYKSLIQDELNDWQLYDGVVLGGWMDGLKGNTKMAPNALLRLMDELHDYVSVKKKVAYQKLQIKGVTAHAWLVVGMTKKAEGYEVGFIDSNNPRMSEIYNYKTGDSSFFVKDYGNFVPYLEFKKEEERLIDAGKIFCGLKKRALNHNAMIDKYNRDYKDDLAHAKKIH